MMKSLLVILSLISTTHVYGWGQRGHETIARIGSALAPQAQFWNANQNSFAKMSTVPDFKWKSGPNADIEKPTHWFQIDAYFDNPGQFFGFPRNYSMAVSKYGEPTITENGTAIWRVKQLYALALEALRRKDFTSALQYAGTMSHYVGDLSQPLHVTDNYDGQKTNNKGIHAYFETALVNQLSDADIQSVTTMAQQKLGDRNFLSQFTNNDPTEISFNEMLRAFEDKDPILMIDTKSGRNNANGDQQLMQIAMQRMADGAATLAVVLSNLWHDSGLADNGQSMDIPFPQWVPPQYDSKRMMCVDVRDSSGHPADDCYGH